MEELISPMEYLLPPSSSCSPPHPPPPPPFFSIHPITPITVQLSEPPPPPPQPALQYLLHSLPQWWTYAIFWRASPDRTLLCFGDGHFRGTRDDDRKHSADAASVTAAGDLANDSDDAEWFYVVSLTRSFSVDSATAPARAYTSLAPVWLAGAHALQTCGCDRSSEAQLHGIETLVFIPSAGGVLELGSGDVVGESWALVEQASLLFATEDVDPVLSAVNKAQVGNLAGLSSSLDSEHSDSEDPGRTAERRRTKKRGRKPGSVRENPVNHVEAERQRREKLNHRFYSLRSVVPNVSRMDKASLLADAVSYIKDLRAKVEELEAEAKRARKEVVVEKGGSPRSIISGGPATIEVEVKLLCSDAIIRVQSENLSHPPARLMAALRDLDLLVHHATVSGVKDMVIQDVVVHVPDAQQGEESLRCALLARLEKN
ncbi:transcription factor MYC4-like [Phalaenopsis equestris]|uniref:transcription factor MYC4-like n=1 Tax=Phalaenopsis equestris TaxID=78828 RepID=UPI0009E25833|nr:transcription factor MYC4-like [Phalaenopsis equestris]